MQVPGIEPLQLKAVLKRIQPDDWIQKVRRDDSRIERYTINKVDPSIRRQWWKSIWDELNPGQRLIVVARVCDSGAALAYQLMMQGVTVENLRITNLSNKEIAQLKPEYAVFIETAKKYSRRMFKPLDVEIDHLKSFLRDVQITDPVLNDDQYLNFPTPFVVKVLDACMYWEKQ